MKKTMCVVLALLLVVSSLAFAGGKAETAAVAADPNAPVTLTVWCWDPMFNIFAMNEAAKIYAVDHPNVKVNVVETPWNDLQQKLITSLSANATANLPDIILMQDNAIQKNVMTYPEAYVPLNGKIDLSQFAQFKVDVGTIDGKHYGVPFDNGATGTFLRRDIVEQAGLKVSDFNDITWERFIELGKIVKQKTGVAMISTVANEPDFPMLMLQSAGTWMFDESGKAFIKDNKVLKEALLITKEMVASGVCILVPDWNAYIATLNNGTVASTINGCWISGSIQAEKSQSGKWAVTNTPRFANIASSVNYSSQGGSGWMVMANSKNPDVAIDFLAKTFGGSVALYETILPASGAIATWLPAAKSPVYSTPIEFFGGQKIYEDLVNYAGKVPNVKYGVYNYEARDAIARALSEVMQGGDIDAALATAQKNVEFLMSE
ncbi:MAG: extracellular solute-binding protein [Sphaerochaeta associata]|uniref:ABC transporter substrate-binding protein n=1 Tax=Sphaerochaeta associata TaxID=1129264 RepID=UPI002B1FBE51|nr:extracellular solute-binding protein [Sphaerochaeta associata]MEA5028033.1 extracellular solute-binding protein [Sphaerochaeta associata]